MDVRHLGGNQRRLEAGHTVTEQLEHGLALVECLLDSEGAGELHMMILRKVAPQF